MIDNYNRINETTEDVIKRRRSIRNFSNRSIKDEYIERIVTSGMYAPSPKNRQPWEFIIVSENKKKEMIDVIREGIKREENGLGIMRKYASSLQGAYNSLQIMYQAPINIFILNTASYSENSDYDKGDYLFQLSNIQSIGACIQNMVLTATQLGIGSLWICDIYFAYEDIRNWLKTDHQLVAALSLGYALRNPEYRDMKNYDDVVKWLK